MHAIPRSQTVGEHYFLLLLLLLLLFNVFFFNAARKMNDTFPLKTDLFA